MRFLLPIFLLLTSTALAMPPFAIDIDLTQQKAFLRQDGKVVYESPICSGRPAFRTKTGEFTITQKSADHRSTLYGKIVGANGKTLIWDADSDMPLPPGAKFVNAPMKHFLRFDGAVGLHAGHLPGYPASHGCVRMPPVKAELFFNIVEIGTPVRVFGKAPDTTPPERPRRTITTATPTPTPAPRKWYQFIRRVERPLVPVATPLPAR